MKELFYLSLSLTLVFIAFVVIRMRWSKYDVLKAKVLSVSEESENVMHRYYQLRYFYPVIELSYSMNQNDYIGVIGKADSRIYRQSELDDFGDVRKDKAYPWRGLSVGDELDVKIDKRTHKLFWEAGQSVSYSSEAKVLFLVSFIFSFLTVLLALVEFDVL